MFSIIVGDREKAFIAGQELGTSSRRSSPETIETAGNPNLEHGAVYIAVRRHPLIQCVCVQEQSSKLELGNLQRQLSSSEALRADLQKHVQQRDLQLETMKSKVGTPCHESFALRSQFMHHYSSYFLVIVR